MKKNKLAGVVYLKKKYKFKIKELTKEDLKYIEDNNLKFFTIPLDKFDGYVFAEYRGAEISLLNCFSKQELVTMSQSHYDLTKEKLASLFIKEWDKTEGVNA